MRRFTFLLACLLATSLAGGAQSEDCAAIEQTGDEVTLRAESWDPVLAIGRTLADHYGISVSVEAPKWDFPGDTEDVAVADPEWSAQHGNIHYLVMKRHALEEQANSQASGRHPTYDHWVVHCDGTGAQWCSIEAEGKFSPRCP